MFTAAQTLSNDKMYFFRGGDYWRYDLRSDRTDPGYPRAIAGNWPGVPADPDAAVAGQGDRGHKVYFFKGSRYWRYDTRAHRVDDGYPRAISGAWKGVWADGIDAAVTLPTNGKIYLFKGGHYIRYDFVKGAEPGYPKTISGHWPGLSGPFDAALSGTGDRGHKIYFFQGDRYWRYDTRRDATDPGYPKAVGPLWRGLGRASDDPSAMVDAFASRTSPGVWPHLPRADVAADMRAKLLAPETVDQGGTPLCGPAAILFALIDRDPAAYVRMASELYETGRMTMRTKTLHCSADVKRTRPGERVSAADWMMMAAMRDAANALFDIEEDDGPVARMVAQGISTPWEMKGWADEILRLQDVEYESCYVFGEEKALLASRDRHDRGGVAFLMIDGAMARNESATVAFPTHWVVYRGGLKIERGGFFGNDMYGFRIWTWGGFRGVRQKEAHFEDNMWGAVYGD